MKVEDFRKMTDEERAKKTRELREELGNLAFQHKLRPLEDTSRMKKIKKDIARLLTVAREKSAS
ncbi:50S ribosomal protein L29 [Desulfofustis limnaeus]|jgi:large subunit ribosomal protein L29|uniref:Large ribosomal subunit protein uL29 n=1 Tax=Desulfofustis limnaeus TaxID=2740163 RepID=A0ABM7W5E1_9BACT|nr:50S ribosomal protein L29 [Desulfofustis limnaeus]MDX9895812.1 50S ribosomal protein L29 [Desulfofustis sp.]BDD86140.1 50S ribosomal protein L29 [Desulfofustis limnaeus]